MNKLLLVSTLVCASWLTSGCRATTDQGRITPNNTLGSTRCDGAIAVATRFLAGVRTGDFEAAHGCTRGLEPLAPGVVSELIHATWSVGGVGHPFNGATSPSSNEVTVSFSKDTPSDPTFEINGSTVRLPPHPVDVVVTLTVDSDGQYYVTAVMMITA